MKSTPEFSIVIPTIGRPDKFRRAVESILSNNGVDFEVIIVDQSPDNETREVVDSFGCAALRYVRQNARGRGRAIGRGVCVAHGEYIAITDDDVVVESNWLTAAKQAFAVHRPCHAIVGRISPYGKKPGEDYLDPQSVEWEEPCLLDPLGLWKGFGANSFFRREVLEKAGGYDPRMGVGGPVGGAGDWELLYRILMLGFTINYCPEVVVWHDGWETVSVRERKARVYDQAKMAAHIKCWFEVGGPALRDMAAECGRTLGEGLRQLSHRHRGTAAYYFRKFGHYISGIPLGLKLAWEGRERLHE